MVAQAGIGTSQNDPGKPWQNGTDEGFNGKFRDECLNEQWFDSLPKAKECIAQWRQDYNEVRPHNSLGRIPPALFVHHHRQRAGGDDANEQKKNID